MDRPQVHYELFVRRQPASPWTLDIANENRAHVVETGEMLFAEGRVAAVKVCKETFDPETGEFKSVTILSKGAVAGKKPKKIIEDREPLCVTPQDLYTVHARDRIGRLLETWLGRHKATPFELLHRPDLVEKLEASGVELQHAIQKIAVPEAQARGLSVHELMRSFQALVQRSVDRLLKDGRRGVLPNVDKEGFAAAAERLGGEADRAYLLGAGVAASLAPAKGWADKVGRILDLADGAPKSDAARALAFQVLEQPLSEILETRAGLADLLGPDLDLGGRLAAMTRLAAHDTVEMLIAAEPKVARIMPPLEGPAVRLAAWLAKTPFAATKSAIARLVLAELNDPRRLRPADPVQEIELLRALAMALTAASGQMLPLEDVQAAFVARSRMLVTGEFVEAYLGPDASPREEVEALIRLVENVIGAANKRQASRWLAAAVGALKFEKDMRYGPDSPAVRLAALATLQRQAARAGLAPEELAPIQAALGELGGLVEGEARLSSALAVAQAPLMHRLGLLMKLATGEAAPLGPAADRARAAVLKMLRADDVRAELAGAPDMLARVRDMMQSTGLAA